MHVENSRLFFSPTDLANFLDGDFATWMDRWQAEIKSGDRDDSFGVAAQGGKSIRREDWCPDPVDPELQLIATRGLEHEAQWLAELQNTSSDVAIVSKSATRREETLDAMQRGADHIFQAYLAHDDLHGVADFLNKVAGESTLGAHHYQVADTKLARSVKAHFIVQLCAYADLLEQIQGRLPNEIEIVLGDRSRQRFPTRQFIYFYRALKREFRSFHETFNPERMPHPGNSRDFGRWSVFAERVLKASDHLSRVANITRGQIQRLEESGISTVAELAKCSLKPPLPLAHPILTRLQTQARLFLASAGRATPLYELQPADPQNPRHGLALLPPPSPSDVFFDIEGFPLVDGGLEYLLGAVVVRDGEPEFHDWWAHDHAQERQSFENFIDWLHARWRQDPTLHVYHYAPYETTAMRRLMGKHGTREREVDDLLRNQVFVDLYTVVRQGLIIGTPSYSLKDIESLYLPVRDGAVKTAGGSVIAYHNWMESGQSGDWRESSLLKEIRDYNEVDCVSTFRLAEWLRGVQKSAAIQFIHAAMEETTEEEPHPSAPLSARLTNAAAAIQAQNPDLARVQQLVAWLLEFHWREAKPVFWRMFDRNQMTEEELFDDFDCLAGLQRTKKFPTPIKRSRGYQYQFDPSQETKLGKGSICYFAHDLSIGTEITEFDADTGLLEIKLGPRASEPPRHLNLIPNEYVSADALSNAVFRFATEWSAGKTSSRAVEDLLLRRPPRIRGISAGTELIPSGDELVSATVDIIGNMDDTVLAIQGPPGTGKTYTAARAIARLVQLGYRIGVTANSHKAVLNLLHAVHKALPAECEDVPLYKVGGEVDDPLIQNGDIQHISESKKAASVICDQAVVVGGTAWLFARDELQRRFDYLFVDEAGQFSLANAVAVGISTRNLILVGDQRQLAQPTLGSHPGESGMSALEYLLNGHETIPPELGVFLNETRRMHPGICGFISDSFYESRLRPHADNSTQRVLPADGGGIDHGLLDAGIVFVPVEHAGCSQDSEHECERIRQLVNQLLQSSVVDAGQQTPRRLTLSDILIVAPFNLQVRKLTERLPQGTKIGSVDRFQGQEAHVAIISLCSSTLEDSPRGADFLLDPNRINVAVSRARTLAIVVGNPRLMAARCQTVREMELVNRLCWLVEHAAQGGIATTTNSELFASQND